MNKCRIINAHLKQQLKMRNRPLQNKQLYANIINWILISQSCTPDSVSSRVRGNRRAINSRCPLPFAPTQFGPGKKERRIRNSTSCACSFWGRRSCVAAIGRDLVTCTSRAGFYDFRVWMLLTYAFCMKSVVGCEWGCY